MLYFYQAKIHLSKSLNLNLFTYLSHKFLYLQTKKENNIFRQFQDDYQIFVQFKNLFVHQKNITILTNYLFLQFKFFSKMIKIQLTNLNYFRSSINFLIFDNFLTITNCNSKFVHKKFYPKSSILNLDIFISKNFNFYYFIFFRNYYSQISDYCLNIFTTIPKNNSYQHD